LVYSLQMDIGQKLRDLRQEKKLSQGDIEHKTGLLRCYVSRVENGFTVPNIETLEKFARALEVPLYRFFTDGQQVKMPKLPTSDAEKAWGADSSHSQELRQFAKAFSRMDDRKQKLLVDLAQKMARRQNA
jgi:transcriptional regulator with XRE-family HTH domain